MSHLFLGSDFEPLIDEFVTHLVDELLERHERSFNDRRQHWESTVDVIATNLVHKELLVLIRSSLTPVLVRHLREAVSVELQKEFEDFDFEISNTLSITLTELLSSKVVPELTAAISPLLLDQLRQSIVSEFHSQQFDSVMPILKLISSRQLQQQREFKQHQRDLNRHFRCLFCFIAVLTVLFSVSAVSAFLM